MEAINYRKPTTTVFPHEIMFVGLIVSMQDLGFMIYKIICCCGVLIHFLGQCILKRTGSIPESMKMERTFFKINSSEHQIFHSRLHKENQIPQGRIFYSIIITIFSK